MKIKVNENTLHLSIGDITTQQTDAIVNAANGSLLGGGGVDGAIHRKAGPKLLEECKQIRKEKLNNAYLATGEAVFTKGYNLPAAYVIHTVGPVWEGGSNNEQLLLANCYQNALQLAVNNNMNSISFPSISTGIYRFPIKLAAPIALETIIEFLNHHTLDNVTMTLFSEEDYQAYSTALQKIQSK